MSETLESIQERCACGAQIRLEGSAETIHDVSTAWRRDHWHTETVGICGVKAPELHMPDGEPRIDRCTLRAGHKGWHHGRDGADWTFGPPEEPTS